MMAIEFFNPLTAGTVLVRSDIRSQNFVSGSSGWRIEADGDAEFNSIVIRGGTVVSGTALYYDGTPALGNLFLSIAAAAGTDEYGNAYQKGLTIYSSNGTINLDDTTAIWDHTGGSNIEIGVGGAQALQELTPRDLTGSTWSSGSFGTNIANVYDGNVNAPSIFLESPNETSGVAKSSISLYGNSDTATTSSLIRFTGGDHQFVSGDMQLSGGQITEYDGDAFTTYTPTVTGGGAVTWTTRTGWWQRIGKMIFFTAYLVVNGAGSGATAVSIDGPVDLSRATRQNVAAQMDNITAAMEGAGSLVSFTGGTGATFDRLRDYNNNNVTGADLLAGAIITVTGWYREA